MIKIITIVAAGEKNRVIGCQGKIPWHLPSDLKRFKELTTRNVVIMGRKTFESLPDNSRPLPERINIVLSRTQKKKDNNNQENLFFVSSPGEALEKAKSFGKNIFIIGGQSVFEFFLPYSVKIILTKVIGKFEGDSFFPEINNEWQLSQSFCPNIKEGDEYRYNLDILDRISSPAV
ncbi:MAG: dihydrofolate reductase [Candidatus Paceibacterota bacterium]